MIDKTAKYHIKGTKCHDRGYGERQETSGLEWSWKTSLRGWYLMLNVGGRQNHKELNKVIVNNIPGMKNIMLHIKGQK